MSHATSPMSFDVTVGSYRLSRVLAEGEVSTIHEAAHLVLPRRAAVKLLRPEVLASPQASQRLLREACVLEAFGHPGVVEVFDCGIQTDGRPWLVMELVGGEPLTALFARLGALPLSTVVELTTGLVDVIAAAHRSGIVHRQLGPSHVMIGGGGDHDVRVLGWGLARQPGGSIDLLDDRRGDVYAIGAMAYQAATGQPPYIALPPVARVKSQFLDPPVPVRSRRPEVPEQLAAIIESMLSGDAVSRPSAAAIAAELAQLGPIVDASPFDHVGAPELHAEGTSPGVEPPTRPPTSPPTRPPSDADRDWEELMALDSVRRPWSAAPSAPRLPRSPRDLPRARRG